MTNIAYEAIVKSNTEKLLKMDPQKIAEEWSKEKGHESSHRYPSNPPDYWWEEKGIVQTHIVEEEYGAVCKNVLEEMAQENRQIDEWLGTFEETLERLLHEKRKARIERIAETCVRLYFEEGRVIPVVQATITRYLVFMGESTDGETNILVELVNMLVQRAKNR